MRTRRQEAMQAAAIERQGAILDVLGEGATVADIAARIGASVRQVRDSLAYLWLQRRVWGRPIGKHGATLRTKRVAA